MELVSLLYIAIYCSQLPCSWLMENDSQLIFSIAKYTQQLATLIAVPIAIYVYVIKCQLYHYGINKIATCYTIRSLSCFLRFWNPESCLSWQNKVKRICISKYFSYHYTWFYLFQFIIEFTLGLLPISYSMYVCISQLHSCNKQT